MRTPSVSHVRLTNIGSLFALTVFVLFFISPVSAQTFTSVTDGSTPSALTPGAPAGSYALSGFENVNLYNGNLNFALPLVHVGGRGGADHTMMLTIEQHWRIRKPKPALNCELSGTCDLTFTFLDQNGNPVNAAVGEVVTDSVNQTVITADEPAFLDSQGRGSDLVSNAYGSIPTAGNEASERAA